MPVSTLVVWLSRQRLLLTSPPLYCDAEGGNPVTQFDKNDVETAGLVKFDFLGLRTLTIIDWALGMVNPRREARGEEPVNIAAIPMDDAKSFAMLQRSESTAVFQLESPRDERSDQAPAAR